MPSEVEFAFDDSPYRAREGQSIAAALIEHGIVAWRRTRIGDEPRGLFCGIGVCFDCLITLNGESNVRACMTRIEAGDDVRSQEGTGYGE